MWIYYDFVIVRLMLLKSNLIAQITKMIFFNCKPTNLYLNVIVVSVFSIYCQNYFVDIKTHSILYSKK